VYGSFDLCQPKTDSPEQTHAEPGHARNSELNLSITYLKADLHKLACLEEEKKSNFGLSTLKE
jgi:hypothetical protein